MRRCWSTEPCRSITCPSSCGNGWRNRADWLDDPPCRTDPTNPSEKNRSCCATPAARACSSWPFGPWRWSGASAPATCWATVAIRNRSGCSSASRIGCSGASSSRGGFAWPSPSGSASCSWPTTTWGTTPKRAMAVLSPLADAALLFAATPSAATPYTLVAFGAYMVGVFLLGFLSHQLLQRGSFLKEYFLGDRQLNAWVLGLTYVATSVSAGSFVGFPSLIYRNGWIMALWIAGYMVTGLVSKGALAKRLNQVSRFSGAITVPDVLRDRFHSPLLGLLASLFLLFFLLFNLVGQFKAGGDIMRQACGGITQTTAYQAARQTTVQALTATG